MRPLHIEKKGLRGLAIAESFVQGTAKSILAGVVMRRDFVIDDFVLGKTTLEGDDATDEIIRMYTKLDRPDISYLLISGVIISMYNIVDPKKIAKETQLPVIAVTYEDSKGLTDAIKYHFPADYEKKLEQYAGLEKRQKIKLHTSKEVYIRNEGCTVLEAKKLLNGLTLQGHIPEPLRVAQLLAKTILLGS
jgi:endonuclease V-like protein UPF0215 family